MIGAFLRRLDAYGTDEPGFREGFPEDRCPVCTRPVGDHPGQAGPSTRARWPHRRVAAFALAILWALPERSP